MRQSWRRSRAGARGPACGWCGTRLSGLHYAAPIATAAAFSRLAVVVNSFSKYFSMTGWRIGWLVLPEDLVRPVECLAQNLFISAPHISQIAAEAAFDCHDGTAANVARYARSRDMLLARTAAGRVFAAVAGGRRVLSLADVTDRTNDSAAFCARMLAEAGSRQRRAWISIATRGDRAVQLLRAGGGHGGGGGAVAGVAVARCLGIRWTSIMTVSGMLMRDAYCIARTRAAADMAERPWWV